MWQTPTPPPHPTPTATPHLLAWQEHSSNKIPPAVVKVSWGGNVETMEILPNGSTAGTHPNIKFHNNTTSTWCDDLPVGDGRTLLPGGAPCIESVAYDIDWNESVSGNQWDWIYFWVRDPDFVAMKAVDEDDCPDEAWPYEYVNRGPIYSICQDFGELYDHEYGLLGPSIHYDVFYEPGAPSTPTSGPTITPPSGPTPCNPHVSICP